MDIETYFNEYPTSNQVFQTSDGYLFHYENDAQNHARTLEQKSVEKHVRPGAAKATAAPVADEASEFETVAEHVETPKKKTAKK